MGIRLVESIKLSCSGDTPRWDNDRAEAAVLFDGEFFAVSCQPDGPHIDLAWAEVSTGVYFPHGLSGWYSPDNLELLATPGDLACDGYIAEPVAA